MTSDDETRVSQPGVVRLDVVKGPVSRPATLPRGTTIDRYVILDVIGHGGMGVVYSAYDPELDRSVALKLVRSDSLPLQGGTQGRFRMLREARALAKLAHPNVVRLYDAGLYDDDVYLAMEMAHGTTLADWLRRSRRSWREIVAVFIQAGRGLSAAHAAGLVHRDFKPANVLVGTDGRVCVLDFGLARGTPQDGETESASRTSSSSQVHAESPVGRESAEQGHTQTGLLIGTPAYMAPEIMLGKAADPRSDQFSFCVSLYEAFYGERPYGGRNRRELLRSVLDGRLEAPSPDRGIPHWLRKIVLRGLSTRPEDRYPSIQALLSDLSRDPARTRRRVGMGLGFFALGVASTYGLSALKEPDVVCTGGEEILSGVWDDQQKEAIGGRFRAQGLPYADASWQRTVLELDDYIRSWSEMHRESCEATLVRHEQSVQMLELRQACLDQRMRHVRGTLNVLGAANEAVIRNAVMAVAALPDLETCSDRTRLRITAENAAILTDARSQKIHENLARITTLEVAGDYEQGLTEAEAVLESARSLNDPQLIAESLFRRGRLQFRLGQAEAAAQSLQDAGWLAEAHRNDEILARARIDLIHVLGHDLARFDEGLRWDKLASAAITRIGFSHDLEADRHNALGTLYIRKGDLDRAADHYNQALDFRIRARGHEHHSTSAQLANLAIVEMQRHHLEKAIELSRQALANWEQTLGPDHPHVAQALNNLGIAQLQNANYKEADTSLQRALDITRTSLGAEHPRMAGVLNNLGEVAERLGDDAVAMTHYERGLEIREKVLGRDHALVASTLTNLANLHLRQGRLDEAELALSRALSIMDTTVGSEHAEMAQALVTSARLQRAKGEIEGATAHYQRSIAIWEQARGTNDPWLVTPLTGLGDALFALGDRKRAMESLERALQLAITPDQEPERAAARFLLARIVVEEQPVRARDLALGALQTYAEGGSLFADHRATVEQWLNGLEPSSQ